MENLNAEQIIKALECCSADDGCVGEKCPYYSNCVFCITRISKDALALINSQEQRIKELAEKNEKLSNAFDDLLKEAETYLKQREAFQSRVKYLEKENARLVEDNHILATEFKDKVKADTVRKMQERLKSEIAKYFLPTLQLQANAFIDQIAKEMLEGGEMSKKFVLTDGQSGYEVIGDYIRRYWENKAYTTVIVSVCTSYDGEHYTRCKTIASPFNFDDIEYLNDWWEGEKYIKLEGIMDVEDVDVNGGIFESSERGEE